jgi:hypothetical protein
MAGPAAAWVRVPCTRRHCHNATAYRPYAAGVHARAIPCPMLRRSYPLDAWTRAKAVSMMNFVEIRKNPKEPTLSPILNPNQTKINLQFGWRIDSRSFSSHARTLSPINRPPWRVHKGLSPLTAAAPSTSPLPCRFEATQAPPTGQGESPKPPGAGPPLTMDGCPPLQATTSTKLEEEELPIARSSRRFPTTVEP